MVTRMRPSETEIAYLAGLIDGEGCIRIDSSHRLKSNRVYHWAEVWLTNTDLATLEEIHDKYGGTFRIRARPNVKLLGNIRWKCSKAIELLKALQPYLRIKRKQCDIALAFALSLNPKEYKTRSIPSECLVLREELKQRIGSLNSN